jgi:adenylate cyclase
MFALCLVGLIGIWVWYFLAGSKPVETLPPPAIITLSVSPFSSDEYFAEGLNVEIANELAQVPGLRIVEGPSNEAVAVLKGTAKKSDEHLKLTAQLIDAKTNFQLWSQTYERDLKDVFVIQEELAKAVINVLHVQIRVDPNHQFARRLTENPAAYDKYLHGRFWLLHNDPAKAADYFEQAARADPTFAAASAALADSYVKLRRWPKAAVAAQQAIDIDGSIAEAHVALGFAKAVNEWDWASSEREFKRAMELSGGSADVHTCIALAYLAPLGQLETARTESQLGADLDPLSEFSNRAAGWILLVSQQYDAAIERYKKALELQPNNFDASWELGMAYASVGKPQQAIEQFQKSGDARNEVAELALSGHMDEAKHKAGDIPKLSNIKAAQAYALIGDKENAFASLEKALPQHDAQLIWLKVDPRYDNLRSDARLLPMLKKIFQN